MIKDGRCFFETFVQKDDKIYTTSMESNGLFVLGPDAQARLIALFPLEELCKHYLFTDSKCYENQIIFAPGSAEHIHIYDTETGQFETIEFDLETNQKSYNPLFKCSRIIETKEYFFFMPNTYPYILRLDKELKQLKYIEFELPEQKVLFGNQYVKHGNDIYMVSRRSPDILKFNVQNETAEILTFSQDKTGGMSIHMVGERLWVTSSTKSEVYEINPFEVSQVQIHKEVPEAFAVREGELPFACSFIRDEKLVLVPMGGNLFLEFDCEKKEFAINRDLEFDLQDMNLACMYQNEETVALCRRPEDLWKSFRNQVFLDIKKMTATEVVFKIQEPEKYGRTLLAGKLESDEIIKETMLTDIRDFMESAGNRPAFAKKNDMGSSGETIYRYLCN
ncbi:MAG: hypothetical protein J6C07_12375 [Lachnospiraceae bacterium]|nr:hypothetical protein [Lachnospiraceae bacterium]